MELVQGQVQRSEDIFEIPLSTIVVEDRERDVYGDIDGLAMSIMQNGQLQPIIVTEHGDAFQLVDGERRYRASLKLKRTTIQAKLRSDLSPEEIKLLELEANLRRKSFEWQEHISGMLRLYEMNVERHGEKKRGAAARGGGGGYGVIDLAEQMGIANGVASQDLELARALRDNPEMGLGKEQHKTKAFRKLRDLVATAVEAELAKRVRETQSALPDLPASEGGEETAAEPTVDKSLYPTLILGDCIVEMKKLPDSSVDLVLADPPYGKDLEMRTSSGVAQKPYQDDAFHVLNMLQLAAKEWYRLLKPNRTCICWLDIVNYDKVKELLREAGFAVYDNPIYWIKPGSGNTPGDAYYAGSVELALHALKGKRSLNKPGVNNWIECSRVPPTQKVHLAQKPPGLLRFLIEQHSLPGETIIDSFAGSGSTLLECYRLGRASWGCELDLSFYEAATAFIKKGVEGPQLALEGDFSSLEPNSDEWMHYWKAHPEHHKEMVAYKKEQSTSGAPVDITAL